MYRNWIWLLAASGCTPAPGYDPSSALGRAPTGERGKDLVWTPRPLLADLPPAWEGVGGNLRAWLLPDRVVAVDRLEPEPRWSVTLTSQRWGRGADLEPIPPGWTTVDGSRFESRRPDLTEWLETTPDGIEQGYTLHRRPTGEGPIVIELAVEGGTVHRIPRGVRISDGERSRLDWTGLVAWDADLQPLRTRLVTEDDLLRIEVDDTDARWPVTVDPLLSVLDGDVRDLEVLWGESWLGLSLDSDGDRLLVGDPGNPNISDANQEGQAWVVGANSTVGGDWGNVIPLLPTLPGLPSGDDRGHAVAIDGIHAAVAGTDGEIYFFREGAEWEEVDVYLDDQTLGTAMDMADERVMAGDPRLGNDQGGVRVFSPYNTGDGWELVQTILGGPQEGLGAAVASTSGRFAASSPTESKVRIYRRETHPDGPTGDYFETAVLSPPPAADSPTYGAALAMTSSRIAVGDPDTGTVYVHTLVNGNVLPGRLDDWGEPVVVRAPSFASEGFGSSVDLYGNTLVVTDLPRDSETRATLFRFEYTNEDGAPAFELREGLELGVTSGEIPLPVTVNSGLIAAGRPEQSAYNVWRRTGDTLTLQDTQLGAGGEFGASAAMDDRWMAIGIPEYYCVLAGVSCGAVQLYARGAGASWREETLLSGVFEGRFGAAVAIDGERVLVGDPERDTPGRAFLYRITTNGYPVLEEAFVPPREGAQYHEWRFGAAVALDGTIAAVGEVEFRDKGRVVVYAYRQGQWTELDTVVGRDPGDRFGSALAVSGGRIFMASSQSDRMAVDGGTVRMFEVASDEASVEEVQSIDGLTAGDKFGRAIDVEGDLLVVGAIGANGGTGEVVVYEWDPVTSQYEERDRVRPNPAAGAQGFGETVALAGDRLYVGVPQNDELYMYVRDEGGSDSWGFSHKVTTAVDQVVADDDVVVTTDRTNNEYTSWLLEGEGPPVTRPDTLEVDEDQLPGFLGYNVLLNDTDPDGDDLEVIWNSSPSELDIDEDGELYYTPVLNAVGRREFTYRASDGQSEISGDVLLLINPANDPPEAFADPHADVIEFYETDENEVLVVPADQGVLYNDTDVDAGDEMTAHVAEPETPAAEGSVDLRANGSFEFTPGDDFIGTTGFWYFARDREGEDSEAAVWVDITVHAANVAPTAKLEQIPLGTITEYEQLSLGRPGLLHPDYVFDEDVDEGDVLEVRLLTPPLWGALRLEPTGELLYTPFQPGDETFDYVVVDALGTSSAVITVQIHVEDVPDPPTAYPDGDFQTDEDAVLRIPADLLLVNDTDIDSAPADLRIALDPAVVPTMGSAVVDPDPGSHGILYTPAPDATGTDVIAYTAVDADGNASNSISLAITVKPVNDAPHAADQNLGGIETTYRGTLFVDGVADPENDTMTFDILAAPAARKGEVTLDDPVTGAFTYTPFPGASKEDQFLYVVIDSQGAISSPGTVRMYVDLPASTEPTTAPPTDPCETRTFYLDADHDGFGTDGVPHTACVAPEQFVEVAGDCDDGLPARFPGATEIAGDAIDQDCDGHDNRAVPIGACATTSANGTFGLLLLTLIGLRRRSAR